MELQFLDRVLSCSDCRTEFIFTAGEQLFFHEKQFKNDPKRCKNCKARRASLTAGAPDAERTAVMPVRPETRTNCSECEIETTVPFKPTQGRPVLCRQCYQKKLRTPASVPPTGIAAGGMAIGNSLHEIVPQPAEFIPALTTASLPHAVTTEDAATVLAALPSNAFGKIISPEAVLMAAASISSAPVHSSVATLQDLESIASMTRTHESMPSIPYELLNDLSAEHVEMLSATMALADA